MSERHDPFKQYDVIIHNGKYYKCRIVGDKESYFEHFIPTSLTSWCSECGEPTLVLPTNKYATGELRSFNGNPPTVQPRYRVIGNLEYGMLVDQYWNLSVFKQYHREMFFKFINEVVLEMKPTYSHSIPAEPKCKPDAGRCVPAVPEPKVTTSGSKKITKVKVAKS